MDSSTGGPPSTAADPPAIFVDRAAASGLDFVHFNGMSGELYYSEMMGSGVALFDADNDGDLDVYLVQGSLLNPEKQLADATFPPAPGMLPLRDRLYRNDLEIGAGGKPRLRFTDVTEASGLRATGYGMGVATGDFDNDGWTDLYVTNAGPNQLWRNNGPGADGAVTFSDVTAGSGADDPGWSLSAAWIDADGDGWLDLYVVDYVDFAVDGHQPCRMLSGIPDYCGPQAFDPLPDRFLRNRGRREGGIRFEEIADIPPAAGMGVAVGDFDNDGWTDLYVTNDGMANQLWQRRTDGTWGDEALLLGSAFNSEGLPEAGMGVVTGDYDGDGDEDLLATNLALETHTLYRNDGGFFEDVTVASGLGASSWQATGFGTAWIDVDNDGWLD
ncbi:MAG: VCBS repeat-containing protein, partial [Thermoanaerobaculia bacterium]